MNKNVIEVPEGIRFISQWNKFSLPKGKVIVNKQITGCGFTEYCLTNPENVILCSPRKILLENKEEQHQGLVFYARNELEKEVAVDKDLGTSTSSDSEVESKEKSTDLMTSITNYFLKCFNECIPCKILVTYDSFRLVKEALTRIDPKVLDSFYVVIDEFQAVFVDAQFKSDTEIEFIDQVKDVENVCFVSATPMMDEYLEMLDEFKDLPYYELDWKTAQPGRVRMPNLEKIPYKSISKTASLIVEKYRTGQFDEAAYIDDFGMINTVQSKEAVIYVNSVKNICDIIKKCKLTLDETNVLCAKTIENEKKVRAAFGLGKGSEVFGHVPVYGEPHKMFTLCTRTVYLGADFYSTNAESFIFSDSNVKCLAVDISLDLPQILGRQRLDHNPWKNSATLFYKTTDGSNLETREEFCARLEAKKAATLDLLNTYNMIEEETSKNNLAKKYQQAAKNSNYQDDYVAVNTHGGKDLVPEFNNLVMISEIRAFDIQQIDYRDRFSVFNAIDQVSEKFKEDEIKDAVKKFEQYIQFPDKLRYACEIEFVDDQYTRFVDLLPMEYQNYIRVLGRERCWNLGYRKGNVEREYQKLIGNQASGNSVKDAILGYFKIGDRLSKADIKESLRKIYEDFEYTKTPKATDLEEYFELKPCQIQNKETGKMDNGFIILEKK